MREALTQLAQAMLIGASFGCQQVQNTYWEILGIRRDGYCEYGFCAIGCANIGLLGYVPDEINLEVHRKGEHFMGSEPLKRTLGVDWYMEVTLFDGSRHSLLGAVSMLNDEARWSVPRIAAWLLMLGAGWTGGAGTLHYQLVGSKTVSLEIEKFIEVISSLENEVWKNPHHESWKLILDPMWWQIDATRLSFD